MFDLVAAVEIAGIVVYRIRRNGKDPKGVEDTDLDDETNEEVEFVESGRRDVDMDQEVEFVESGSRGVINRAKNENKFEESVFLDADLVALRRKPLRIPRHPRSSLPTSASDCSVITSDEELWAALVTDRGSIDGSVVKLASVESMLAEKGNVDRHRTTEHTATTVESVETVMFEEGGADRRRTSEYSAATVESVAAMLDGGDDGNTEEMFLGIYQPESKTLTVEL